MHPLFLLWDIDGTLLTTNGAGEEALRQALLNEFGVIDDLEDIEIAGRTDTAIASDICRKHHTHNIKTCDMVDAYIKHLAPLLIKKRGQACPGVHQLLDWSHNHPEVHNALLTGNVKKGAYMKLKHYDLDRFFEFGAFGDDSPDRDKLGPIVMERARTLLKKDFHIECTWVIGDTPKDIRCARALGCKVLAVATGRYSVQELQNHQPDLVVANLSDYNQIIAQLERR